MITLFPDQIKSVDKIRAAYQAGYRAPLFVLPTGGGKTVIFTHVAGTAASRGHRVYILVHRRELVEQTSAMLRTMEVPHGLITAGHKTRIRENVQVASVQTLAARIKRGYTVPDPSMLIVDEAHHAVAGTWDTVIQQFPKAKLLGVTATPTRTDGKGLDKAFNTMVIGPSADWLMRAGRLSQYEMYCPSTVDTSSVHMRGGDFDARELEAVTDTPTITGDAVVQYSKHCPGARVLAFCVSRQHAHHVAEQFRQSGIPAEYIGGDLDTADRRRRLHRLRTGETRVIVSVDLISEGFDVPAVEGVILLRPTLSLGLYLQQVGRGLRASEGKDRAIILDHVGNAMRHGFPDDDRDWSLEGSKKKRKSDSAQNGVRICPECFAAFRGPVCRACGNEAPAQPREVEQRDGELIKLTREQVQAAQERMRERMRQGRTDSLQALIALGKERGYKNPEVWANHVFGARNRRRA